MCSVQCSAVQPFPPCFPFLLLPTYLYSRMEELEEQLGTQVERLKGIAVECKKKGEVESAQKAFQEMKHLEEILMHLKNDVKIEPNAFQDKTKYFKNEALMNKKKGNIIEAKQFLVIYKLLDQIQKTCMQQGEQVKVEDLLQIDAARNLVTSGAVTKRIFDEKIDIFKKSAIDNKRQGNLDKAKSAFSIMKSLERVRADLFEQPTETGVDEEGDISFQDMVDVDLAKDMVDSGILTKDSFTGKIAFFRKAAVEEKKKGNIEQAKLALARMKKLEHVVHEIFEGHEEGEYRSDTNSSTKNLEDVEGEIAVSDMMDEARARDMVDSGLLTKETYAEKIACFRKIALDEKRNGNIENAKLAYGKMKKLESVVSEIWGAQKQQMPENEIEDEALSEGDDGFELDDMLDVQLAKDMVEAELVNKGIYAEKIAWFKKLAIKKKKEGNIEEAKKAFATMKSLETVSNTLFTEGDNANDVCEEEQVQDVEDDCEAEISDMIDVNFAFDMVEAGLVREEHYSARIIRFKKQALAHKNSGNLQEAKKSLAIMKKLELVHEQVFVQKREQQEECSQDLAAEVDVKDLIDRDLAKDMLDAGMVTKDVYIDKISFFKKQAIMHKSSGNISQAKNALKIMKQLESIHTSLFIHSQGSDEVQQIDEIGEEYALSDLLNKDLVHDMHDAGMISEEYFSKKIAEFRALALQHKKAGNMEDAKKSFKTMKTLELISSQVFVARTDEASESGEYSVSEMISDVAQDMVDAGMLYKQDYLDKISLVQDMEQKQALQQKLDQLTF